MRKRSVRRRPTRQILLAILATSALFLFLHSDFFNLREVTVSGLETLSEDGVRKDAGLDRPLLIWQVWPRRVEGLLLQHPRVAAARVNIRWPNRVAITIEERHPVAYLIATDNTYMEVDGDAQILSVQTWLPGTGHPLITGVEEKGLRPGDRLRTPGGLRATAVVGGLGPPGADRVSEVHVNQAGEVVLYTMDGLPVFMGIEDHWDAKLRALFGILATMDDPRQALYIDLRSSRRPVVKMRDTEAAERAMTVDEQPELSPDLPLH